MVKKKISILIPCYNEEASVPLLWKELSDLAGKLSDYEWEFLFIDDGSTDNTENEIRSLRKKDSRVNYIGLSRNFGKEMALVAGLDYASGDAVVIMDADLQHPVSAIPQMINYWEQGYDDVYGKRLYRGKETWWRKKVSLLFYKILSRYSNIEIQPNVGDFRLLDRKCVEALKRLRETERYTKGLYGWIGFNKKEILISQGDRMAGCSSWNLRKLSGLALNGITSFSSVPLQLMFFIGGGISLLAFFYLIFVLVRTAVYGDPVRGFPTLIIIILFLGGIQILCFGIIGLYLSRIFNETKNRPPYIIKDKEGNDI